MIYNQSEYGLWDNIISLMLMNENRIVRKDIIKVYGKSADYSINKLIREGYLKIKFKRTPRLLYVTSKGINRISKNKRLPDEILRLNKKRALHYSDSDMIRLARKSQVITDMMLNEVPVSNKLISKNTPLFIPPVFLRQEFERFEDKKAGITCKGVLTNNNNYYGLYSTLNGNQILSPNIEAETVLRINECLKTNNSEATNYNKAKIIFDDELKGLPKIIKNNKSFENYKARDDNIRPTKHILDAGVWGSAFYVPTGEASKEHIKAILNLSETRARIIKNNNLGNNPIIFYPYNIAILGFMVEAKSNAKVYVLEKDREVLEYIINNNKVELIPISTS